MKQYAYIRVSSKDQNVDRQRQAEGIAAAKARGVKLGRKPKQMPEGFEQICLACAARELTVQAAADHLGVCKTTFIEITEILWASLPRNSNHYHSEINSSN